MPNTLAHIGVQGALTRVAHPGVDLKWVLLGLTIPDLPWILQRLLEPLVVGDPLYDVRLYVVAQRSLFVCAVLCGALALVARTPRITFVVLFANSLLHLLLDALQKKFANGVHLLAPLSWKLTNFGLFWPENPVTVLLTLLGPAVLLYWYFRPSATVVGLSLESRWRVLAASLLLVAYFALPLALMKGVYAADNHSVRALREPGDRSGRAVEFDRNRLIVEGDRKTLLTFAGEPLRLVDAPDVPSGDVSIRGRFVDDRTVTVAEFHLHADGLRDWASYAGLFCVLLVWADWIRRSFQASRGGGSRRE
jgi:hypothetical protein